MAYAAAKATGTAATETTEAAPPPPAAIAGTPPRTATSRRASRVAAFSKRLAAGTNGAVDHGVFIVRIGR